MLCFFAHGVVCFSSIGFSFVSFVLVLDVRQVSARMHANYGIVCVIYRCLCNNDLVAICGESFILLQVLLLI